MASLEESLIFGSLFAGIGGFDLGFERAGMRCAWSVEIDDRCNEVRAHHWPDVRQYKDVRDVGQHNLEPVDVICGGFPCQDLSVAGRRAGLAGERSGLWWEFHRIIEELSPRWAIIENVPGLLSSWSPVEPPPSGLREGQRWETDETSDFDTLITSLAKLGYGYAWATLDAQYFGLAQRRRRVFIVGCLGDWRGAPQVLFEPESGERDSTPRRETGQRVAGTIAAGAHPSGFNGYDAERGNIIARPLAFGRTIDHYDESQQSYIVQHAIVTDARLRGDGSNSPCLAPGNTAGTRGVGNNTPIVFEPRHYTRDNKTGGAPRDVADITNAHKAGDSAPVVAYGFSQESDGSTVRNAKDLARPITGRHGDPGVVAFNTKQNFPDSVDEHVCGTLRPGGKQGKSGGVMGIASHYGVRRLTPLEAERLQGFPDTWTVVNGMSDSARYRMLGNAVAVPVAEWIGKRITEVDCGKS